MNLLSLLRVLFLWVGIMSATAFGENIRHVAIFTTPFRGHFNIMFEIAKRVTKANIRVSFYLSSWSNLHEFNRRAGDEIGSLKHSTMVELEPYYVEQPPMDPLQRKPLKVATLLTPALCAFKKDPADIIIFDMLAPEAKIISLLTNTHSIAIGAALAVPKKYAQKTPLWDDLTQQKYLNDIVDQSGIRLEQYIIPGAALPVVLGDETYALSLPELSDAIEGKITDDEGITIQYLGPRVFDGLRGEQQHEALAFIEEQRSMKRHVIYLSLGTVVSQKVYNGSRAGKKFIKKILASMKDIVTHKQNMALVISSGEAPFSFAQQLQSNKIAVFSEVSQVQVLQQVDLFVTHGGANSVNEAALIGVPMLVIPFFDDQHFCAQAVEKTGLGKALAHPDSMIPHVMFPMSGIYDRECCNQPNMTDLIEILLSVKQQTKSKAFALHAQEKDRLGAFIQHIIEKIEQQ